MRCCTGPRLGTILCRQLAFAFQLSSPILLLLSSCFLHPVLSLCLSLSRLQHLHFTGMLTRQNKTLWFAFFFYHSKLFYKSKAKAKTEMINACGFICCRLVTNLNLVTHALALVCVCVDSSVRCTFFTVLQAPLFLKDGSLSLICHD